VHDNFVQRWLSSISSSPVIFIAMTKSIAPERNNGIGTFDSPMHSCSLKPGSYGYFTTSFLYAARDTEAKTTKKGVAHSLSIRLKIAYARGSLRMLILKDSKFSDDLINGSLF